MVLNRRDFLKLSGVGVGTFIAHSFFTGRTAIGAVPQNASAKIKAVLYDGTLCIGCKCCEVACKLKNGLPLEDPLEGMADEDTTHLSAYAFTKIRSAEVEYNGKVSPAYIKMQCMHCSHPACAEACIVGALQKREDGPVTYDDGKCIGCRYCQVACPFGIPAFEWDKPVPWIRKCGFCADRQDEGLEPICVDICPNKALKFGDREELLAEARERISAEPGKYVNHIYGEKEVGGTSWLYISPVPFKTLGFDPHIPEPVTINVARAMGLVPSALIGVTAAMTGIYWLTKRRLTLNQEKVTEELKEGDEQ
ncbi:4Fe-4S dicluster domain-containing protein [Chloroflexota bacterium]